MSVVAFEQLANASRLWIYPCSRELNTTEIAFVSKQITEFLESWTAHKRELETGWQLVHQQFIMVGVDERRMAASGCSVDSLVRFLKQLETELACPIVGTASAVFYRSSDGCVRAVDRAAFKKSVQAGEVTAETIVFDNTILTVGDFRGSNWEIPFADSWHRQAFPAPS